MTRKTDERKKLDNEKKSIRVRSRLQAGSITEPDGMGITEPDGMGFKRRL